MDIVIDDMNMKQVTQAMYENVKSNQHRLDEIEPVINKMAKQVDRLDQRIVGNGLAKAVKDNTRELKDFRKEFQDFNLHREDTCPVLQHHEKVQKMMEGKRNWKATVVKIIIASIGGVSTLILIIQEVSNFIGG